MTAAPKNGEQEVLDSLLGVYPGFLKDNLHWEPGPNPPDYIGKTERGERFGLELTEWLHESQTTVSIANQDSKMALLQAIDSEQANRPIPLTRVIVCDRPNVPFRKHDRDEYVRELYRLIADLAPLWEQNEVFGIWNVMDLAFYPTLKRYCECVALYGPPHFVNTPGRLPWNAPGRAWIEFEAVGGVYDPQWSVDALISRIQVKTRKYRGVHRAQNLTHFALLAHFGIRGIIHNTPYKGRNARLEDATIQAHQCLLADRGEFDSAYLYMDFNGGKLVQLFPQIATLKEYSHQPGQH